jgi:hypothetical protein
LSEKVIGEVIFALQRQRDVYEANGAQTEVDLYERYCDSLYEALGVADGGKRSPDQMKRIRMDVLAVSSPFLLDRILPFPRSRVAYRAVMKLAGWVHRAEKGLRPRPLFGLFG